MEEGTELDKTIIEAIKIRSRISCGIGGSGIETPECASPPENAAEGRLLLRAFHEAGR